MSFGGQMGLPGQPNPGEDIYKSIYENFTRGQKGKNDPSISYDIKRNNEYANLMKDPVPQGQPPQGPGFMQGALKGITDNVSAIPGVMGESILNSLNMKPVHEAAAPQQYSQQTTPEQPVNNLGQRPDGSNKGQGYFGSLRRPDGNISTELSAGVNIDGREQLIPLLVPTLSIEERDYLLSGGKETPEIIQKAVEYSKQRSSKGLSPFAQDGEQKSPVSWKVDELGTEMGSFITKNNESLLNKVNTDLESDDPSVFAESIENFTEIDKRGLNPESPAARFIKQADGKYLQGTTEEGDPIYQCPFSQKPCGKKTFWSRLKEFFKSMLGITDAQNIKKSLSTWDSQDPITQSYSSNQQQPEVQASQAATYNTIKGL